MVKTIEFFYTLFFCMEGYLMIQTELIWYLQCNDLEKRKVERSIEDKTCYKKLSDIKKRFEAIKEELTKEAERLDDIDKRILKLNMELKHLDDKLKNSNERLYNEGYDLKSVDKMQKEIENYKDKISMIEDETLSIMDESESLKKSIRRKRSELIKIKNEYDKLKAEYIEEKEKNTMALKDLNKKREEVIKHIDKPLLDKYNALYQRYSDPVSKVDNGICTGCSVKISASLLDVFKRDNCLCYCDYCGRILYKGE